MKTLLYTMATFIALISLLTGWLMMSVPSGSILNLNPSFLKDTPFTNFIIPGVSLFFVGVINVVAVFSSMIKHPKQYSIFILGGIACIAWIGFFMVLLNTSIWFDVYCILMGLLIVLIALHLKGRSLI